ncbi:toll/interleukin-1 receptor domain-containing protein, partial [Planctomycetota bacterium]
MKDAFISHVDEDRDIAESIATELEASGCSVWYYERDSIPGLSYLSQTRRAIDEAKCLLFLVSPSAIERHHQVDKELVHAHEACKHIIPILRDTSFRTFQKARPEWHQAIGAVVGVELSSETIRAVMPRLLSGLRALGIASTIETGAQSEPVAAETDAEPEFVVEDTDVDYADDDIPLTVCEDFDDDIGEEKDRNYMLATIVHEHPKTGFLADVVVTESDFDASKSLCVAFSHKLLKPSPYVVEFQLGSNLDPVQYVRLANLFHGHPVVLRIHWLTRLPSWSTFNRSFGVTTVPSVRVKNDQNNVPVNDDAAGILVKGQFKTIIPPGAHLPRIEKKRFRTVRDSQKAISVTPAVRRSDGSFMEFPKFKLSVPIAPCGVAWMEFTFRIDPDGRFTLFA